MESETRSRLEFPAAELLEIAEWGIGWGHDALGTRNKHK